MQRGEGEMRAFGLYPSPTIHVIGASPARVTTVRRRSLRDCSAEIPTDIEIIIDDPSALAENLPAVARTRMLGPFTLAWCSTAAPRPSFRLAIRIRRHAVGVLVNWLAGTLTTLTIVLLFWLLLDRAVIGMSATGRPGTALWKYGPRSECAVSSLLREDTRR
jgi:hypothetical protein